MTGPIHHLRTTTVLSFSETFDANLSGILLAIYRKLDEKAIISKYTCSKVSLLVVFVWYASSPYALRMLQKCFPNNVNGRDLCCYLSRIYAMIKQGNREIAAFTILWYMRYVRGMHILLFLKSWSDYKPCVFSPFFESAVYITVRLIDGFLQLTATRKISIGSLNQ